MWQDNSNNEIGFIIERSDDSSNFMAIDSVSSDISTYIDEELANDDEFFYRVLAYNENGNSAVSNTASARTLTGLSNALNSKISVYPNPAGDFLNIELESDNTGQAILYLYDLTGKRHLSTRLQSGYNRIELENVRSGLYTITLVNANGEQMSQRLVIQ